MPPQLSSSPPTYLEDVKKLFTAPSRPLVRSLAVRSVRIRIASSQRGAAPIDLPLKVRPALILLNALDPILLGLLGFHPASSRVVPINDKVLHFVAFFLASLLFYSIWDVPSTTRRTSVLYRYLPLALSFFVCFFVGGVGSEFVQKYLGEGPRMVRDVFRLARENAPAIIFIDEIDAIATKRFDAQTGADREVQRILLELLNQMDGFDQGSNVKVRLFPFDCHR